VHSLKFFIENSLYLISLSVKLLPISKSSIRESKFDNANVKYEIIVVNDGSKDRTLYLLENNKNLYDVLINNPVNMGKGFSVKEALKKCTSEYIIFQDADLEYNPDDYKKFFLLSNKFSPDLIIGSRFNYDKYIRSHNYLNSLEPKLQIHPLILNVL
jgi:glycosyltransferase involved in cell wall biosynthesis